ncbi:reverse transcriptase family protein [Xanthomonas perforans]
MSPQARPFANISSLDLLKSRLQVEADYLTLLAEAVENGECYTAASVRIRGKDRTVHPIRDERLRKVQVSLVALLNEAGVEHSDASHAYRVGRSTVTGASVHLGAKYLQKFDVDDFFGSINRVRVRSLFQSLGMAEAPSALLARITTLDDKLPIGAVTSPSISNLTMRAVDDQLSTFAAQRGLRYTRYADDLSFTGSSEFDASEVVEQSLRNAGYKLNSSKTKRYKSGQPLFVTGISVSGTATRLSKRDRKRIDRMCYIVSKYGIGIASASNNMDELRFKEYLAGHLSYIKSVNRRDFGRLSDKFPAAFVAVGIRPQRALVSARMRSFAEVTGRFSPVTSPSHQPRHRFYE